MPVAQGGGGNYSLAPDNAGDNAPTSEPTSTVATATSADQESLHDRAQALGKTASSHLPPPAVTAATRLSNLTITAPGATLSPAFARATTRYTASVAAAVDSLTIDAPADDDSALVAIYSDRYGYQIGSCAQAMGRLCTADEVRANGFWAHAGEVPLLPGDNHIVIIVIAGDGIDSALYRVVVTRAPDAGLNADNNLATLTVTGAILSPAFDADTVEYTATAVAGYDDDIVVTATASATTAFASTGTGIEVFEQHGGVYGVTHYRNAAGNDDFVEDHNRTVTITAGGVDLRFVRTAANGVQKKYLVRVRRDGVPGRTYPVVPTQALSSSTQHMVESMNAAVAGRIGDAPATTATNWRDQTTIATFLRDNDDAINADGDVDFKRLLAAGNFEMPITGGASFWAGGGGNDYAVGNFAGDSVASGAASLGLDTRLGEAMLLGAAVSWSDDKTAYTTVNGSGEYEINLTTVQPYLGWNNERVSVWGSAGAGEGTITVTRDDEETDYDAVLDTFTIGGSTALSNAARIKAEITQSTLAINDDADTVVDTNSARLLLSADRPLYGMRSNIEFGFRNDSGDGDTGTALETRAGLRGNIRNAFVLSADMHMLSGGERDEWSVGGGVELAAKRDGQGLHMALQPRYTYLAERDQSTGFADDDADGFRVTGRLAYGISAMLIPYAQTEHGGNHEIGLVWKPQKQIGLTLLNEKTETANAIKLKGEIDF